MTAGPIQQKILTNGGRKMPSRQLSEPPAPPSAQLKGRPGSSRQFSEPIEKSLSFAELDPRVAATCRQVSLGMKSIPLPPLPAMYPLPPLPRRTVEEIEEEDYEFDPDSPLPCGKETPFLDVPQEDSNYVKCVLSPEDSFPVLMVCVFMSLAQGTAMCSFFGSIGFFSRLLSFPQLILYTNIAQSVLTPVVLDLQRRYDHIMDARFGHKATFLFRIGGLSILQTLLLLWVPFSSSWFSFLVLSCVSASITVAVFAQVCMVISCTEGAQAVNFARTACHAGGVVVLVLAMYFGIGTQSDRNSVFKFFASAALLQAAAVLGWYREHRRNTSLAAAYAIIAAQQSYSAQESARRAACASASSTEGPNGRHDGYTLATMFGKNQASGMALLCSFCVCWVAWSLIQPVMNMFGDEDLTQLLVLNAYLADTLGRLLSHLLHGLTSSSSLQVPPSALHGLTFAAVAVNIWLLVDTQVKFLGQPLLLQLVFGLCFVVTFNMNELSVKTMQAAKSRAEVAHCQNYVFFVSTGFAKFGALAFQFACGTA